MLSEGWDAKTVTHIMGLRAFTSQLLCEQVVGRGLRRTTYEVDPETGLFEPEYVNIFGVPFTFLPHEGGDGRAPPTAAAEDADRAGAREAAVRDHVAERRPHRHVYEPRLTLDLDERASARSKRAHETATLAELAPIVDGKPDVTRIDRDRPRGAGAPASACRRSSSRRPRDVFDQMRPAWTGSREVLLAQLVALVERFLALGPHRRSPRPVQPG